MGSLKEQIIFLHKLNRLISTGVPFGESFHIIEKETENKLLKEFALNMMAMGEANGYLDKAFERIVEYLLFEKRLEFKQHSETICN